MSCCEEIEYAQSKVFIKSPTFGDRITIQSPKCRFGSSKNARKDLKHIEA